MRVDGFDLAAEVDAAWVRFQGRLGDRLGVMEEDEGLLIEVETGLDDDEMEGTAPYLQYAARGDGMLRAEVVGNTYLDDRFALADDDEERLQLMLWEAPDDDQRNYHHDVEIQDADRVAVMSVSVLREIFGVPHPSFLLAEGLERDPGAPEPSGPAPVARDDDDEDRVIHFPHDGEELQGHVDTTVAAVVEQDQVEHDGDGDIPILAGSSMVFVRVSRERPAVELFAEIVNEVEDMSRLPVELDILNRGHPFAKFYVQGNAVVMMHQLCAAPYVPMQLTMMLTAMLRGVDDLARDLAERVGGQRFLELVPEEAAEPEAPALGTGDLALLGLLELLHLRPVSSAMVAMLFDHDRGALVRTIVGVRTGSVSCDDLDEEIVLDHLRRGLHHVVGVDVPGRALRSLPPKPSQQLALLPEGEAPLDAGRRDTEAS
ncbi:MAG: hypothetical protein WKF79_14080 [Nocardioides sp.]